MKNWLNENLKIMLSLGLTLTLIILVSTYFLLFGKDKVKVTDFNSCVEVSGGIANTSYPAKCIYDGITYTQNLEIKPEPRENLDNRNLDLPESEKSQIEAWLEKNGYNQYG
ncbi:MAG: hypothetical protein WD512_05200, partial [Candidatus Paceibacterota bacterium]